MDRRAAGTNPVKFTVLTLVGVLAIAIPPPQAQARTCVPSGSAVDSAIVTQIECSTKPNSQQPNSPAGHVNDSVPAYSAYHQIPACQPSALMLTTPECQPQDYCPDPETSAWQLFGLSTESGSWMSLGTQCLGADELPEATPAEVTPAIVLRALRRMGLPEVEARTQPEGTTLVNFDTIFYADASTQTRDVTLLGRPVTIEATPSEFTWHHGDGTSRTTTTAGAPYPAKDVVHRYARATGAGEQLRPRVDVTYTARFRVADGPWREIGETVTIGGPPGALGVTEATPALTGASTG